MYFNIFCSAWLSLSKTKEAPKSTNKNPKPFVVPHVHISDQNDFYPECHLKIPGNFDSTGFCGKVNFFTKFFGNVQETGERERRISDLLCVTERDIRWRI
jgi:hypothetical protein